MCQVNDDYVQLTACSHGVFQFRVGNTTLHLSPKQVAAICAELKPFLTANSPRSNDARRWPTNLKTPENN
jgi:hypothetical protein